MKNNTRYKITNSYEGEEKVFVIFHVSGEEQKGLGAYPTLKDVELHRPYQTIY